MISQPDALDSADAHRGVLVQPLLEALERGITHADTASEEEAQLFCYALYLLAKWREPRAYPLVVRWLSLSDAVSTGLSGDVSTQDGARILAAVCDGDLEPIKRLVLNRDADDSQVIGRAEHRGAGGRWRAVIELASRVQTC